MTTSRALITAAYRSAGAISSGDDITGTQEETDGLEILNMMIGSWFANGILVPYSTKENFTLSAGTASYTIGTGLTFNTVRPNKIISAFIRDGGYDYPLEIIGERQYWEGFSDKTATGRPEEIFFNPSGTIYFHFSPDQNYDFHMFSEKMLAEITDASATFSLPREYEEAIKYNLAVRFCDELNRPVTPEKGGLAMASYNRLVNLNVSRTVKPVSCELGRTRIKGNIFSGYE